MLKDLLGTKYITIDHTSAMMGALSNIEKGEIVDLAYCRLCPTAESVLRHYYGKVQFCNSKEPELDKILKHNNNAVLAAAMIVSEPLPINMETESDIIKFFKTVDKTKCYSLNSCRVNWLKGISLAILLSIQGPGVMLDLKEFAGDLFKQVRVDWLKNKKRHKAYNEVIGGAIVRYDVVDGKVYKPGIGWIDEELFVYEYNVLPAEFGTEYLNDDDEFADVWQNALTKLCNSIGASKTMRDYIELVE